MTEESSDIANSGEEQNPKAGSYEASFGTQGLSTQDGYSCVEQDETQYRSGYSSDFLSWDNSERARKRHANYMETFIASMRISYAWGIFSLVVCWLSALFGLLLVYASASINLLIVGACVGVLAGFIISTIWCKYAVTQDTLRGIDLIFEQKKKLIDLTYPHKDLSTSSEKPANSRIADEKLQQNQMQSSNGEVPNKEFDQHEVSSTNNVPPPQFENSVYPAHAKAMVEWAEAKEVQKRVFRNISNARTITWGIIGGACLGYGLAWVQCWFDDVPTTVALNEKMSEKIIITLITTTTASVLGLFIIVLKWLFPHGGNKTHIRKKRKRKNSKSRYSVTNA